MASNAQTGAGKIGITPPVPGSLATLLRPAPYAPEFQATLNSLVAEARAEMQQGLVALQEKAINTLKECMSSPNHMVRVRTALSVLDRVSGLRQGPTSVQSIRQMALPIGPEDLDLMVTSLKNQNQTGKLEEGYDLHREF